MNAKRNSQNKTLRNLRLKAAAVDMGLAAVVAVVILQLLRLNNGFNGNLLWFFMLSIFVFEFRDAIGKRSVGKRIFGLRIVSTENKNDEVSTIRLLKRNMLDIILPLVIIDIFKSYDKNGDMLAKTKVCIVEENTEKKSFLTDERIKKSAVIVAVILFCIAFYLAGYLYLINTDAYSAAIEYLSANGYSEDVSRCRLKGGNVLGNNAAFSISDDGKMYNVFLHCSDDEWSVTNCSPYEIG